MPSGSGYIPISDNELEDEKRQQRKKSQDEQSTLSESTRPESRLDKIKNVFLKTGYPSSVWYILGNEFCERFSYYGMHAILVIYLTQMLKMDDDSATAVYHAFNMLCYFSPLFGAMLADSFLGKYKTILYVSIIYAIGNIVVAVTSIPSILSSVKLAGPMIGLLLIAIGTGGIKPCVSAFGGDQFRADQEDLLQSFFSIFYFAINLGSFLSMIVTPLFRGDVKCFGYDCYPLAFGVPALLMILSVALFICGRKKYRKVPPEGNVVLLVTCAVGTAVVERFKHYGNGLKKAHWLDWAEGKYGAKMIGDVKALFKVLFMFLPLPVFWTLFDQQGSRWTLQAEEMDGDIGALGPTLKPDQMQALNPVFILILIPIFEKFIYPLLGKCRLLQRPLQRMCTGMAFASLSFIMAAFLQIAIQRSRNPVEIPPENYANLRFINAGWCNLKVTGHGLNLDVPGTQPSAYQHTPVSLKDLRIRARNCSSPPPPKTFSENLTEHQVHTFVIGEAGGNLIGKELEDKIKPLKQGLVLVRFLYVGGDVSPKVDIRINKTHKYEGITDLTGTDYHKLHSAHYTIRIYKYNTTEELLKQRFYFGNGGIFSVVIKPKSHNSRKLTMTKIKDVKPSSISMLWQIPQYLTITTGEVLFSITGLEFAYSQSPVSMKSVIMAGWLLTVSIGNAIVVVFAEARVTQNMASEFFFFAGLLGFVLLIFILMSYFYKYETFSVNGVAQEPNSDEIPLTETAANTGWKD